MGGLRRQMPITAWTFLVASLANVGIFPLAGFWSKDEILFGAFAGGNTVLWALTAGGVALTGFYMLRCYYLAFEGPSRAPSHAHPAHESPAVMSVPLVILAIFAIGVGFVGFPPEHGAYHRFVEAVFVMPGAVAAHAAPAGELVAMDLVSLLIAVAGVLTATWFYCWRPKLPDRLAAQYPTAYRILLNKYYVDEIYDALFVEPIKRGAVWLWRRFDEPVVDGSVNGVGAIVRTGSILLRYLQTGYVMNYVLSFILGVVVILGYVALWR